MHYIYAALLLHKAGKEINEENLKKVMESVGIEVDESKIKTLVTSLKGVDIEKTLEEARTTQVVEEKPKEEKKEEKKETEPAAEGLSALFG